MQNNDFNNAKAYYPADLFTASAQSFSAQQNSTCQNCSNQTNFTQQCENCKNYTATQPNFPNNFFSQQGYYNNASSNSSSTQNFSNFNQFFRDKNTNSQNSSPQNSGAFSQNADSIWKNSDFVLQNQNLFSQNQTQQNQPQSQSQNTDPKAYQPQNMFGSLFGQNPMFGLLASQLLSNSSAPLGALFSEKSLDQNQLSQMMLNLLKNKPNSPKNKSKYNKKTTSSEVVVDLNDSIDEE